MYQALRKTLKHFPRISRLARNTRDVVLGQTRSRHTPWGWSLAGHRRMAEGHFERVETELVRKLLEEVDVLVNVGANVGYYCCHALGLGKSVIAVEPLPRNLTYLLRNIADNGWSRRAEVFPMALAAQTDIMMLYGFDTGASLIPGWASSSRSTGVAVPVTTLDRLIGRRLDGVRALIVVDVEGAEYHMLQGASGVLEIQPAPIWLIEICSTEHQPAGMARNPHFMATCELFLSRGYRAFRADASMQELSANELCDIGSGRQEGAGHNFIFRRS
jgi:FkbM family methyltransferase